MALQQPLLVEMGSFLGSMVHAGVHQRRTLPSKLQRYIPSTFFMFFNQSLLDIVLIHCQKALLQWSLICGIAYLWDWTFKNTSSKDLVIIPSSHYKRGWYFKLQGSRRKQGGKGQELICSSKLSIQEIQRKFKCDTVKSTSCAWLLLTTQTRVTARECIALPLYKRKHTNIKSNTSFQPSNAQSDSTSIY